MTTRPASSSARAVSNVTESCACAAGLQPAVWAVSVLAAMTVLIGLAAGPVMDYAVAAAEQLTTPLGYIDAVIRAGGR